MKKTKVKSTTSQLVEAPEYKQSMHIKSDKMPIIKKSKIGNKIRFTVIGKVKGIRQSYDNPNTHEAEIEIHSMKHNGNGWKRHIGK